MNFKFDYHFIFVNFIYFYQKIVKQFRTLLALIFISMYCSLVSLFNNFISMFSYEFGISRPLLVALSIKIANLIFFDKAV